MIAAAAFLLACLPAGAQSTTKVAGGVVSSREWRVKRANGEAKEEEFTGEVRYRTGPNVLRCEHALYDHARQVWRLNGRVIADRTLDSGDRVQAAGDSGYYEMEPKSGWLSAKDRVTFLRTPADGTPPDYGSAGRLQWSGEDKAWLEGGVRIWGPRADAWSDRADYLRPEDELTLKGGRPVLRKHPHWDPKDDWEGAVKADVVRAWQSQRRLSADGSVAGWLLFAEQKKPGQGRRR